MSGYESWKKQVLKELGGKPFDGLLRTNAEDLTTEPVYTHDHHGPVLAVAESDRKYLFRTPVSEWEVRVDINASPADTNRLAMQALEGGANGLGIQADGWSPEDFQTALEGVILPIISVHLTFAGNPMPGMDAFRDYLSAASYHPGEISGSIHYPWLDDALLLTEVVTRYRDFARFRLVPADGLSWREEGASAAREMAVALALGHEALHRLTQSGFTADDASGWIAFSLGTSQEYFTEIARYRAMRYLWMRIIRSYAPAAECSSHAWLTATATRRSLSAADHHTNLLRLTTEAMSALLGGVNALSLPAPELQEPSAAARRWARNIHHILREEARLHEVVDPAAGSWYLESLCAQLAQSAWADFIAIEDRGGLAYCSSELRKEVRERGSRIAAEVESGKRVVIGQNKYQPKG